MSTEECSGKTCPISLELIPKKFKYEDSQQHYNVRQLAQMVLTNRQSGRQSRIPHTRRLLSLQEQTTILKRAGRKNIPIRSRIPSQERTLNLWEAIDFGNEDTVRYILDYHEGMVQHHPVQEVPVLHYAAGTGNYRMVYFLIEGDFRDGLIEVNERHETSDASYTPLEYTLDNANSSPRYTRVVKILLEMGANVNTHKPFTLKTPLMMAGENVDIVKLLLQYGANVNARDSLGRTALMVYASNSRLPGAKKKAIMKLLIEHGADVRLRSKEGRKTARDYTNLRDIQKMLDAADPRCTRGGLLQRGCNWVRRR
jgi:ankyrin repeat protein